MEECKTKGCTKKVYMKGLCEKHYQELRIDASTTPANKRVQTCVCPVCGTVVGHTAGIPCSELNCPYCGSRLIPVEPGVNSSTSQQGNRPPSAGQGMAQGCSGGSSGCGSSGPGGPSGECVCPNCGTIVPQTATVPCYEMNCPKCGTPMVRAIPGVTISDNPGTIPPTDKGQPMMTTTGNINQNIAEEIKAVHDNIDLKASVGIQIEAFLLRSARSAGRLVSTYKRFTKLGVDDAGDIYLKKADSYEKKGQYNKSASFMQKVIELKPDAGAYSKLGFYYENIGMNKEAIDAYNKAIEFDANNLDAHYRLGILYSRNNSHNEAMIHLKKARELGPEYAEVHYRLGVVYDKNKKYNEAIECFNKTIEIDPFNIQYYKSLGFTYDSKGMHDESIACFKKAVELEKG